MPYYPPPGGSGVINVSAGTTSNTLTAITFSNANGVSFGINASTITASVGAAGGGLTNINVSAGTTSNNLSNVVFSNSNNVSFGLNGSTVTATATVASTQGSINLSAGTTSNLASAFTFNNANGVSFGLNASTITATVKTDYAGTGFTSAGNNIGISGTQNTAGLSLSATVAAQSNQSAIKGLGVSNTGQTAGNTGLSTGIDWVLAGSQSITLSQSTAAGGPNTIWFQHPAWLTTAALSGDTSKYVQAWELTGNTSGTTSSLQGTKLYFSGGNNITISGSSNTIVISGGTAAAAPVNFSAGTTSNNLASVVFSNSNGVSFGLNGSTITASAAGGGNSFAIGVSTEGNEVGTTGSNTGTYWLQGGNAITLSQITSNNGSHTVIVSGNSPASYRWFEPYPLVTGTTVYTPGAGAMQINPITVPGLLGGWRLNFGAVLGSATTRLMQDIGETAYVSTRTGSITQEATWQATAILYTQGTGTNNSRLESLWSNTFSLGYSKLCRIALNAATNLAVSLQHNLTYMNDIDSAGNGTTTSYTNSTAVTFANSSSASTALSAVFSSGRNIVSGSVILPFGFNTTLTGGNYWIGWQFSSTNASTTAGGALSTAPTLDYNGILGLSRALINAETTGFRNFGSTVTTARSQFIPGGQMTNNANSVQPNIVISADINTVVSAAVPYLFWAERGLTL